MVAPLPRAPDRPRLRFALVLLLLGLHAALCVSSLVRKSHTSDEVLFITGGLGHWLLDDHRMGPEAGLLPQRWATLPLLFMDVRFPSSSPAFADGDVWAVGHELLYDPANDLFGILIAGYYLVSKQRVWVDDMFVMSETGRYWFTRGVNPNAVAATIIGGVPAIAIVLTAGAMFAKSENVLLSHGGDFSWFVGCGLGLLAFWLLEKYNPKISRLDADRELATDGSGH